jgi:hypothetical protein
VLADRLRSTFSRKQLARLRQNLLLILADLNRMNPIFLGNFVDNLDASYRLQADLGLELRSVNFSLFDFAHRL